MTSFESSGIEPAVQEVGADRVVFGSNLPAPYADLAVQPIKRHGLHPEVEQMILGGRRARGRGQYRR